MYIIVLLIVFIGGGWLIGKVVGNILFPKKDDDIYHTESKPDNVTIHNHITKNNLHISKEDLKYLIN